MSCESSNRNIEYDRSRDFIAQKIVCLPMVFLLITTIS